MTSTYRLRLLSVYPYSIPYLNPPLTREAIIRAVAGATVRELTGAPQRGYDVHLGLDRASDADALDEIAAMAVQFGLAVAEAYVVRWTTRAAEAALGAAIAGGSTHTVTKDAAVTVLLTFVGGLAGYAAGSLFERVACVLRAECDPMTGTWCFEQCDGVPDSATRSWAPPRTYLGPRIRRRPFPAI